MQRLPSPLDSPRFFDDAALSAWSVGDRSFAAARKSVVAKSLVYSSSPTAPRLSPEHPSDAISVEIVRGSNGLADDGWTVLIDGIRCRELKPILQEGRTTFRCVLPPGVAPPEPGNRNKAKLNTNTKVRPVVVGIRLEEEALAPTNAIIVVEQVLDTSERSGQDPDRPDIQTLKTIQLIPYRVSDLQSNAVVLQYPFHCPAQSVLGLLSMDTVAKWKEDQNLRSAWNAVTPALNAARESVYTNDMRARINTDPNYRLRATVLEQATQKFLAPSRPKELKYATTTPPPTKEESTETFRIGGGRDSSARALGDLFATLSEVCLQTHNIVEQLTGAPKEGEGLDSQAETNRVLARVQKHFQVMEVALIGNNDTKALALLRALLNTKVNHKLRTMIDDRDIDNGFHFYTKLNIRTNRFDFSRCGEGHVQTSPATVLTDEQRKQLGVDSDSIESSSLDATLQDTPPYAFTYDRIILEVRKKTTVYTRFKVVVEQEGDLPPFSVEFVSDRQDGFVANSVYSGELDDIEYMDKESIRFIDCLICGPSNGSGDGVQSTSEDFANNYNQQKQKDKKKEKMRSGAQIKAAWFNNFYTTLDETQKTLIRKFKLQDAPEHIANVETRIAELRIFLREMLPVWPTPSPTAEDYAEMDRDYAEMDREFERLQKAADSALANVTELSIAASSSSEHNWSDGTLQTKTASVGVAAIGNYGNATMDQSEAEEKDARFSLAVEEAMTSAKIEAMEEEEKRLCDQIDAIATADQEAQDDGYNIVYKAAKREQLLIRHLPQIVKPKTVVYISFKLPKSVNPPTSYKVYRPVATSSLWQTYVPSLKSLAWPLVQLAGVIYFGVTSEARYGRQRAAESGLGGMLQTLLTGILAGGATGAPTWSMGATIATTVVANQVTNLVAHFKLAEKLFGNLTAIANYTLVDSRQRFEANANLNNAGNAHFQKERGVPVRDAFAAATNAASRWRKSEENRITSLAGVITDASVVYNPYTGKRFRFVEYFEFVGDEVVQYKPLYTDTHWASVGDVNAFHILPPSDVDEAYIRCVDQRGMSLAQTISFVTGGSYSYSRPSAQAAFSELYNTVILSLKTMHSGQRVERSGPVLAVDLAKQGALVMKAVFGKAAGVTLVGPDDILWTCLRASTFARLALRHLAVFSQAPSITNKTSGDDDEFVRKSIKFWRGSRREAVDQFADDLIVEARKRAQEASAGLPPSAEEEEDSRKEAKLRYDRVKALLASPEVLEQMSSIMSVVDSSVHTFQMPALQGDVCDKEAAATARQKINTSNAILDFEYQASLQPPSVQKRNDVAAWASRRVDTSLGRSMCLGNGAESVLGAFASLNLGTNTDTGNATVFYCPTGSRLDAVPASVPFDTEGINNRVVWTSALREAAENILCNIQSTRLDANSWHIDAQLIGENTEVVGFARHPSALQTKGNRISLQLSSQSGSVNYANYVKLERVALMRRVAYNADRIFFALSLAYSYPQDTTLCIRIPHQDVACLAIAVAMRHFEGGVPDIALRVYIDDADADGVKMALTAMQKLVAQATAAFQIGCRVVSLAEAAMCV